QTCALPIWSRRSCRLLSESCCRTRDCGCKEPPGQFRLVVHMDLTVVILARLAQACQTTRPDATQVGRRRRGNTDRATKIRRGPDAAEDRLACPRCGGQG